MTSRDHPGPAQPRRSTLRTQLLLPLAAGGLVALLVLGALVVARAARETERHQIERADRAAAWLARAVEVDTTPHAQQARVSALAGDREVRFALLAAGAPLRVVAAVPERWRGQSLDVLGLNIGAGDRVDLRADGRAAAQSGPDGHPPLAALARLSSTQDGENLVAVVGLAPGDPAGRPRGLPGVDLAVAAAVLAALLQLARSVIDRRVIRPLEALVDVVQAHRQGDRSRRAALTGDNELARLGAALNQAFDRFDELGRERDARDAQARVIVASLQAKKRRFELMSEASRSYLFEVDREYRITYVSDHISEVRGIEPAELLGSVILDGGARRHGEVGGSEATLPAGSPARDGILACVERGEPFQGIDLTLRHRAGHTLETRLQGVPRRDDQGQLIGALFVVTDVSQLRGENERLRQLLAVTPGALFAFRAEAPWAVTFASDGIEQPTGFEAARFTGEAGFWSSRVHPQDLKMLHGQMPALLEQGRASRDYRLLHRDGRYRWIHDELRTRRDPFGAVVEVVGFGMDMTPQRELLDQLHTVAARLQEAQSVARIGSWHVDLVTQALSATDEAHRLFDLDPSCPVQPARILERLSRDEGRRLVTQWDLALAEKRTLDVQVRLDTPQGERWIRGLARFDHDRQGRPVRAYGTVQDITERVQAEQQLRQAQKLEIIGQLTGTLAHDFNNLLGIVVGHLDVLGPHLDGSEPMQGHYRAALDAALRGTQITRGLLGVARRQPLDLACQDLNGLVVDMLPLLAASAGASVELRSHLAPGRLDCVLDAAGLSNVVLNLIVNARDAMHESPRERVVTLRTRRQRFGVDEHPTLPAGDYVVLEVGDTGPGMSEAVRARAFEPFFTTKVKGKGTGLGLAMVHGYAHQLGGTVLLDSVELQGTTVTLVLPRDPALALAEVQAEAERLHALRELEVLDTPRDPAFDAIVAEAARVCGTPMALVTLVDEHRQWFKAAVGIDATQTPRDVAICAHAILDDGPIFEVPDTRRDVRFSGNPVVSDGPRVGFYAGTALRDASGHALGMLCVIDHVPRQLSYQQRAALERLGGQVADLMGLGVTDSGADRLGQSLTRPAPLTCSAPLTRPAPLRLDAADTPPRPSDEAPGEDAPPCIRALVVDDEISLCELAGFWLRSMGFEVEAVHSPVAAIERLQQASFDLLFTDIVMPGAMDGVALARRARTLCPELKVVLASGHSPDLRIGDELPGPLLPKPYRKADLVRVLSSI